MADLLGKVPCPPCAVNLKKPAGAVSQVADQSIGGAASQAVGHVLKAEREEERERETVSQSKVWVTDV